MEQSVTMQLPALKHHPTIRHVLAWVFIVLYPVCYWQADCVIQQLVTHKMLQRKNGRVISNYANLQVFVSFNLCTNHQY